MGVTMPKSLEKSDLGLEKIYSGKVRDIYAVSDDTLLLVATDRISAFDAVLSPAIPNKGKLLTRTATFWFGKTQNIVRNHMLATDLSDIQRALPKNVILDPELYAGRVMLVRKAKRIDAECVVRGYVAGSGWKEYQKTGKICGHTLPSGLKLAQKLPEPIFTPATKADEGHDENISRETLAKMVGAELAARLEKVSLELYTFAAKHMEERGLILADTKFEFGFIDDELCLIDEALTSDSSRFWEQSTYKTGVSPDSFDKQFVRDYLEKSGWDKKPPAPTLPEEVVTGTTERYQQALKRLTQ
jgi:phosphoribosylaminoimidazole-succinocarboxamide synthase